MATSAALVFVTAEVLEKALGLPEGTRITGMHQDLNAGDHIRNIVRLRIEGSRLPVCAEGSYPCWMGIEQIKDLYDENPADAGS